MAIGTTRFCLNDTANVQSIYARSLRAKEVVLHMGNDEVTVLKCTNDVYLRVWGQTFCKSGNTTRAAPNIKVVLNIFLGIDVRKGLGIARFQRLQHVDRFLFIVVGHCFVSYTSFV